MTHIVIHNTAGADNVERASLAYILGNTALAAGQEATILSTINGVFVPTEGYADDLQAHEFPALKDLVSNFVTGGGSILVCGACAKPRNITADDLIDGAELVGAMTAIELMVEGAKVISL